MVETLATKPQSDWRSKNLSSAKVYPGVHGRPILWVSKDNSPVDVNVIADDLQSLAAGSEGSMTLEVMFDGANSAGFFDALTVEGETATIKGAGFDEKCGTIAEVLLRIELTLRDLR